MAMRAYDQDDCTKYHDMHELLDRSDIDATLICTGDRWHALASIRAAKAGKDIYCEKPCSMTIRETQELADTVNRYQRIFQAGTQRRNVENFRLACELAQAGKLGKLRSVHAGILPLTENFDWLPGEPDPDPKKLDWDAWLGPAPWRPYNKKYTQGRWRGYYDFNGGATLPEWGAHTIDLCQWAANADGTGPVEYEAIDDQTIHATYADGIKLVMRIAGFKGEGDWKAPGTCPVRFEGDEGWVEAADSGQMAASQPSLIQGLPEDGLPGTDPTKHVREFLDCVKSRRQPASSADVTRYGHIVSHAASIAWRLGRKVKFDPKKEVFLNDPEANRMASRARRAPYFA
jgi:predicted dehydrogenase